VRRWHLSFSIRPTGALSCDALIASQAQTLWASFEFSGVSSISRKTNRAFDYTWTFGTHRAPPLSMNTNTFLVPVAFLVALLGAFTTGCAGNPSVRAGASVSPMSADAVQQATQVSDSAKAALNDSL
jgi:hypothetical protein